MHRRSVKCAEQSDQFLVGFESDSRNTWRFRRTVENRYVFYHPTEWQETKGIHFRAAKPKRIDDVQAE